MKKSILVVDDRPDDLHTMKTILEKEGYRVVTAGDGADGLAKIKKNRFNLILTDINLPEISGYELSKTVRKRLKKKVKIIYVSITPKSEVYMANVDGFIQKPFLLESFISDVKQALEG